MLIKLSGEAFHRNHLIHLEESVDSGVCIFLEEKQPKIEFIDGITNSENVCLIYRHLRIPVVS